MTQTHPPVNAEGVSEDLRGLARTFFERECTPQDVRASWEPGSEADRTRWAAMAELGFFAVGIPAEYSGLGLTEDAFVGPLEEAGYAGLPEPLLETAVIVAAVIRDHGTAEQRERWLPAIAAGEVLATTQLRGATQAPYGDAADVALVAVGDELHLVPRSALGAQPVASMDGSRHTAVLRPAVDDTTRLPAAAHRTAAVRGAAGGALLLNGLSRRMLEMSVSYAGQREQFGRLIGSFQAVKHLLAEVACAVETARPLAWHAMAAVDTPDAEIESSAAKAAANAASALASLHSLQVHGGIGFTWEHDLHLWMKRARAMEPAYGSTKHHHRLLGAAVLASADVVAEFGPLLPGPGAREALSDVG